MNIEDQYIAAIELLLSCKVTVKDQTGFAGNERITKKSIYL
jgi:hypothetical protein